jgi:nucleoside phosphorylase
MAQNSLSHEEITALQPYVDILLITAAETESRAVLQRLRPLPGRADLDYAILAWGFTIGCLGSYVVAHFECSQGGAGHEGAILATDSALRAWSPKVVLMPGMAYGLKEKKGEGDGNQELGHVLVAKSIVYTGHRKIKDGVITTRGGENTAETRLGQLFRQAARAT